MLAKRLYIRGIVSFIKAKKGTATHRPPYYTILDFKGSISIVSISEAGSGLLK